MADTHERYWRIRIKFENESLDKQAWARGEVGIWYGGWSADDWLMANTPQNDPAAFLSAIPLQARLRWPEGVPKSFIDTARRFTDITARDWVLVFFEEALHLARVSSGLASDADHP